MMKEPLIRIEDVLNGKYRFVEGQPVRRSYVDMEKIGIENMKYKVGDKVKIKSLDWYNENKDETDDIECSNNIWFYREMSKFCGKVMTISHIRADHYTMVEDLVGYWTDEMIERKVGQVEEENQSREMLKENAKHYWEVITGGSKPKFKVGDRVLFAQHPCVVNKVEWRGDSKYVGYVYTVRGTDFGKKVKEADLMLDPRKEETKSHNNMCKQLIDEMNPNVEVNVKVKTTPEPKFNVGDIITNGKTILTIVALSSDKCTVENSFEGYSILHFKNQDEWEIVREEDLNLKFKAGDRVFNKVTRKWVNIIEFDIETGLYIVRYDDGIQGRSLENELCETQPSFKEIKEVVKKKAEVYINSKTELDGLSKSLLYEGFVDGMMTALIEMEE